MHSDAMIAVPRKIGHSEEAWSIPARSPRPSPPFVPPISSGTCERVGFSTSPTGPDSGGREGLAGSRPIGLSAQEGCVNDTFKLGRDAFGRDDGRPQEDRA